MHDLIYGTIAQQVAADSGTPVMLIKPTEAKSPFELNHILVPLDNESIHDQALPFAKKIAKAYRAELDLVCVIPTLGTLSGAQAAAGQMLPATATAYFEIAEEIAHDHFQAHLDEFQKAGIQATAVIARGDPSVEILKAAREQKSSLLIFGTHGRVGMDAFWNRSITANVARRLDIPVLLIPLPS
jgi:nucleotide-binding universal stress UspA family protein